MPQKPAAEAAQEIWDEYQKKVFDTAAFRDIKPYMRIMACYTACMIDVRHTMEAVPAAESPYWFTVGMAIDKIENAALQAAGVKAFIKPVK